MELHLQFILTKYLLMENIHLLIHIKDIVMNTKTHTEEIANAEAAQREFTITDKNYENLPISDGNIT